LGEILANSEHLKVFTQGPDVWNLWRKENPSIRPDLSDIEFMRDVNTSDGIYSLPEYHNYDLSRCNMNRVSMRNCVFIECDFSGSDFHFSDLVNSYCLKCNFHGSELQVSKIGSAEFIECDFGCAKLNYCSAEDTKFIGSKLVQTDLSNMSLVKTDFTNATIDSSCVYGISAWDLVLDGSVQNNIFISGTDSSITVPNIELAQFISLLVNNSKIRDIIDTITSKVVLILGRFSPERKSVLDSIKSELQEYDYLPVLFDFDSPSSRDVTETVMTLASLAKFVVADLSSPKSIPQELKTIVPNFPSIPVQPIIHESQKEYGMFEHFKRFPWVLSHISYSEENLPQLVGSIVASCEAHIEEQT